MNYEIDELEVKDKDQHTVTEYRTLKHLLCNDDLQFIMRLVESERKRGFDGPDEVIQEGFRRYLIGIVRLSKTWQE